jgi:putative transposase
MPGARYFVTCCTKERAPIFSVGSEMQRTRAAMITLHEARDFDLIAATVMPDHVHLLFTLGARLSVGQVMAKLKFLARNRGAVPWRWQEDGFEHRLRPHESTDSYAFYIFMNPYCAGLCSLDQHWLGWVCPRPDQFQFLAPIHDLRVPAEWLAESDRISRLITAGE